MAVFFHSARSVLPMLTLVSFALSGCAQIGPRMISTSRPAYNMAVQQTNDQELLLNLVRIRYRDTTYFTSVERIAATQEFNQGLGGTISNVDTRNTAALAQPAGTVLSGISATTLGLTPTLSLNEKPTVFYVPLEGEKFVRQLMTPMNPDILLLLVRSGWSIDRVFALGVQEMNGLKNAPTAAGITPGYAPEFRTFREAVRLLRILQREQLLDLVRAPGSDAIELRFARSAASREETVRLKMLLGLNSTRERFRIVAASEVPNPDTIAISTRPLMSALNYLAQAVRVPEADYAKGTAKRTLNTDGSAFDWQELLSDVFLIESATALPEDAATAIEYRNHYFYIANTDLESKATFVLLTQLMALHAGSAQTTPAMSFSFGK